MAANFVNGTGAAVFCTATTLKPSLLPGVAQCLPLHCSIIGSENLHNFAKALKWCSNATDA
ncbi:MAG: hypothetical protein IKH84_06495, partial [Ottowia sp.]|nr:hypothetical protein [Ottowia sp.]